MSGLKRSPIAQSLVLENAGERLKMGLLAHSLKPVSLPLEQLSQDGQTQPIRDFTQG